MPHVQVHRDVNGRAVDLVYDRAATEGDAYRFVTAESGRRELIHISDVTTTDAGIARVTAEPFTGSHLFELSFNYIVAASQLEVWVPVSNSDYRFVRILSSSERDSSGTTAWTGPAISAFTPYFEEVGASSVRVYGIPDPPGVVLFTVPHTSIPAESRNKVVVRDQGDNKAVELLGLGDGVVFRSPSGQKFLLRVDDSGSLVTEPR